MNYFSFCEDEALKVAIEGKPVHRFFSPKSFLRFGLGVMDGSTALHDQIVDMEITVFLGLAEPIPEDDEKRHAPLEEFKKCVMDGKKQDWELPVLVLKENEDGIWKVVGHDGRHRALLLNGLGYSTMPVHISIPDGLISEELMPDILWCQNDKNVEREQDYYPFPIKAGEFNAPYVVVDSVKIDEDGDQKYVKLAMDGGTTYPAGCDSKNLKDYIGGAKDKVGDSKAGQAPESCVAAKRNFSKNFVPNVAYRKDNTMPASTLKEFLLKVKS